MKNNSYTSITAKHFALKAVFVSMLFLGMSTLATAQSVTQTIRGIVKSEDDNQPVPGTNIFLKSASSIGTLADANGQFEFPNQLKAGDIIVFSFLGLKTTEYAVPAQAAGFITITMPSDFIQIVDEVLTEGDAPAQATATTVAKRSRKVKANR